MNELEVWVIVDVHGDYGIGTDADSAVGHYTDNIGAIDGPTRMVKVKLSVPEVKHIELSGVVPEEVTNGTLTVS